MVEQSRLKPASKNGKTSSSRWGTAGFCYSGKGNVTPDRKGGETRGKRYGYIRVSSTDQNEDRQKLAMAQVAVPEKIFIWTSSPARTLSARQYKRLVKTATGRFVYILSIDRLGAQL